MCPRKPYFFDTRWAIVWSIWVQAITTICELWEKLDTSFIECQSMAKVANMLHSGRCIGQRIAPRYSDRRHRVPAKVRECVSREGVFEIYVENVPRSYKMYVDGSSEFILELCGLVLQILLSLEI